MYQIIKSKNIISQFYLAEKGSCFGFALKFELRRAEQSWEQTVPTKNWVSWVSGQARPKMASVLQPKTSGGPITKFWEAPETISALEHVKGWLCKHAKKVGLLSNLNIEYLIDYLSVAGRQFFWIVKSVHFESSTFSKTIPTFFAWFPVKSLLNKDESLIIGKNGRLLLKMYTDLSSTLNMFYKQPVKNWHSLTFLNPTSSCLNSLLSVS